MNLNIFDDAGALKDFVVAQAILQPKIVTIIQRSGKWYLFWYT